MEIKKEILLKLMAIESTEDDIYKEILRIQKELKEMRNENQKVQNIIEDIFDFIRFKNY